MNRRRPLSPLLAGLLLTTMLAGCTDLQGLLKTPVNSGSQDLLDQKPGESQNPGDQLLSNGAATAVTDVVGALREVGSLKYSASQKPLISNSAGTYRISAATGAKDDFERIVWTDDGAWPEGTVSDTTVVSGTIIGKLDGVAVEHYTYTITLEPSSYSRTETVVASSFRQKGTYVTTGTSEGPAPDELGRLKVLAKGESSFSAEGIAVRKLAYEMDIRLLVNENMVPTGDNVVTTAVIGTMPNGGTADVKTHFELLNGETKLETQGSLSVGGREVRFDSHTAIPNGQGPAGYFAVRFAENYRLRFAFEPGVPIVGTLRNDADAELGPLPTTEDKTKVVLKHPDGKMEHLELQAIAELFGLTLTIGLPPL